MLLEDNRSLSGDLDTLGCEWHFDWMCCSEQLQSGLVCVLIVCFVGWQLFAMQLVLQHQGSVRDLDPGSDFVLYVYIAWQL